MKKSSRFFRRWEDRIGLPPSMQSKPGIVQKIWKSLPNVATGGLVISTIFLVTSATFRSGIVVEPFTDGGDTTLKAAAFTPRLAASIAAITRTASQSNLSSVTAQIDEHKNIDITIGGQTLNLDGLIFYLSKYVGTAKIISGDVYKSGDDGYGAVMQFNGTPISGTHTSSDLTVLIDQLARQIVACANPILFSELSLSAEDFLKSAAAQSSLELLLNCDGSIRDRDRAEFSTALSLLYQELGALKQANSELERAVEHGFRNTGLWAEYALRAYFDGSYQIALRAAREAIDSREDGGAYTKKGLSAKVALATAIHNELIGSYELAAESADSYIRDETNEYDRYDAFWWMKMVNLAKAGKYTSMSGKIAALDPRLQKADDRSHLKLIGVLADWWMKMVNLAKARKHTSMSEQIDASDPRLLKADDRGHPKLIEGWAEYGLWMSIVQHNWSDALAYSFLVDRIHSCAEPTKEMQRLLVHSSAIRILSSLSGRGAKPTTLLADSYRPALETCYPCVRASGYEALLSDPPDLLAAENYFSKAIAIAPDLPFAYAERGFVHLARGTDAEIDLANEDFSSSKSKAPQWWKDRFASVKRYSARHNKQDIGALFSTVWANDEPPPQGNFKLKSPAELASDLDGENCKPPSTFYSVSPIILEWTGQPSVDSQLPLSA